MKWLPSGTTAGSGTIQAAYRGPCPYDSNYRLATDQLHILLDEKSTGSTGTGTEYCGSEGVLAACCGPGVTSSGLPTPSAEFRAGNSFGWTGEGRRIVVCCWLCVRFHLIIFGGTIKRCAVSESEWRPPPPAHRGLHGSPARASPRQALHPVSPHSVASPLRPRCYDASLRYTRASPHLPCNQQ
jgi:hypothetical protein